MPNNAQAAKTTSRLPEGFGALEQVRDVVVAGGIELHRAGVCVVSPAGETITGSAAGTTGASTDRAHFELLERVATLEAIKTGASHQLLSSRGQAVAEISPERLFPESPEPLRFRYARSNGVALHQSFRRAALRARWELAERDRVLRSWCGHGRPVPIAIDHDACALRKSDGYFWQAFHLGRAAFAPEADVVSVIGFPSRRAEPLAMGFAARPGVGAAFEAALSESLQSLSFLWGEPLPSSPPPPGPTPLHHLEHFQYPPHHEQLRSWLSGEHFDRAAAPSRATGKDLEVRFVSLTPDWLPPGLAVVKAVCDGALQLAFGDAPVMSDLIGHLPPHLRAGRGAHPVA